MNWIRTTDGSLLRADLLEQVTFAHEQEALHKSSPHRTLGRNTPITVYGYFRLAPESLQKHALHGGYQTMAQASDCVTGFLAMASNPHTPGIVADLSQV